MEIYIYLQIIDDKYFTEKTQKFAQELMSRKLRKKANDIFEKIENADIPEVEKVEILTRLAFILTEKKGKYDDNRKQKQYIVFLERKETLDADGNCTVKIRNIK